MKNDLWANRNFDLHSADIYCDGRHRHRAPYKEQKEIVL